MGNPMDTAELASRLEAFCRAHTGDATASVSDIEVMPGHAGFSWGFRLDAEIDGQRREERLIIRMPPPGVRWVGTADVLRQARVMQALRDTEVPVPAVRWAGDDLQWFGCPYTIVERLPGDTLRFSHSLMTAPIELDAGQLRDVAAQVTRALVALHRLDWQQRLPDWGPPPPLADEVHRWEWLEQRNADPARSSDPSLTAVAPAVRQRLLGRPPMPCRQGILHGDYQWSNHLFHEGRLLAVVDWELASVGETLMDLGWLALFSDLESWVGRSRWDAPLPAAEEVIALYEEAMGAPAHDVAWYRALAGYKFALITGLNLTLHRRGKRPDPHWEEIGPSAPRLLERALELLA